MTAPVSVKTNQGKQKNKMKVKYLAMPDTDLYSEEEMAQIQLSKHNKKISK